MENNKQDVAFAQQMIPHHEAAITMAQKELAQGVNPQLKTLAEAIIAAQTKEIAVLKDWLKQAGAASSTKMNTALRSKMRGM